MGARTFPFGSLVDLTGGIVLRASACEVSGVALDSRRIRGGNLFVALSAIRRDFIGDIPNDAHGYCDAAVDAGAAAVMVEKDVPVKGGAGVILVKDALGAMHDLGCDARASFAGEVIAIVGSCGKTTTKDFTAAVLGQKFAVSATDGNRNNTIGAPETILNSDQNAGAWVVEVGVSAPGEMAVLAPLVRPTCTVFTTIAPVHLEQFGTLATIRNEKASILKSSARGGVAVINADDVALRKMEIPRGMKTLSYGRSAGADLRIASEASAGTSVTRFRFESGGEMAEGVLGVPGSHQVMNFAAACCAGLALGMSLAETTGASGRIKAAKSRGETVELARGITLIDDSYNSNPAAVASVLASASANGRRLVAALGEMRELGAGSIQMHRDTGDLAARLGVAALLSIGGAGAKELDSSFSNTGRPHKLSPDWQGGAEWLLGQLSGGELLVVKGSRAIGLDGLVGWLKEKGGGAA